MLEFMKSMPLYILFSLLMLLLSTLASCKSGSEYTTRAVKPKIHHTWYKKHVYKKKWHLGRIRFYPEKQGVKQVKMKN